MARGVKVRTEAIEQALKAHKGFISGAAAMLGVTRRTIERRVAANQRLRDVLRQERENFTDIAEASLQRLIRQGNPAAIIFYLKTRGKDRGYVMNPDVSVQVTQSLATGAAPADAGPGAGGAGASDKRIMELVRKARESALAEHGRNGANGSHNGGHTGLNGQDAEQEGEE